MTQDNRPVINVKDVLALLEDGKTREQIREHYGLTKRDIVLLFKHEDLKGKKTRIAPGFVFAQETPSEEFIDRNNETNTVEDESVNDEGSESTDGIQLEGQDAVGEQPSQWANN